MLKICIIGGGNISNSRHIPALRKLKNCEIVGVLSKDLAKVKTTAAKYKIANFAEVNNPGNDIKWLRDLPWFREVDAVVIGVPPREHFALVKMSLELGKHTLVEKPMMMNETEVRECINLAKSKKLVLAVMHNFQFANKMQKLNDIIFAKKYGEILSITEIQFSNRNRRLPEWYNDLPLGLFYDEAAHFSYLPRLHAGEIKIENSFAAWNSDKNINTPDVLTVNARAGAVPLTMLIDITSPVCEWWYIVNFKDRICAYDLFKDILIDLPTDNEHTARDILRNSFKQTAQYWRQFIANGFRMVRGSLLYGHDIELAKFLSAIETGKLDENISGSSGLEVVKTMNEIVRKTNPR